MPLKPLGYLSLWVGLIGMTGCGPVQQKPGLEDVRALAHSREITPVQWNRGTEDDRAVETKLQAMLQDGLTADEAVQIALLNNRDLQSTYESLRIAQADLVQAGMLKNPVFDGSLRFVSSGAGQIVDLGIALDFLDILFIPLRKHIAEDQFENTKLQVAAQVMDLAGRVKITFFKLQAAEKILDIHRQLLTSSEASYDLSRRLRSAGNITLLQTARHQADLEEAKLALNAAEIEVITLHEELNVLMGFYGPAGHWKTNQPLPDLPDTEIPTETLESKALEQSLDLKIARRHIELSAKRLGVTKPLGLVSEIETGVTAEKEADGQWSVGPTLAVPVPIFSQGQPAVAKAESALYQALNHYYSQAVQTRSTVRRLYAHLQMVRNRAQHLKNVILPLQKLILDESQTHYNAMQLSAFDLLKARNDELLTQRRYVEALRDYWIVRSQLEQTLRGRVPQTDLPTVHPFSLPVSSSNGDH